MKTTNPNPYTTAKHTLTLLETIYRALKKSAEKRGVEPNELIVDLIVAETIKDGTLDDYTKTRYQLGRSLVERVVDTARQLCRDGKFSESINLDVIHLCTMDKAWAADYRTYVEDDIFKHGNPLKVINREFGFRIRAAIGGKVKKGPDGKPLNVKVAGEIIQSYTPMVGFERESL